MAKKHYEQPLLTLLLMISFNGEFTTIHTTTTITGPQHYHES